MDEGMLRFNWRKGVENSMKDGKVVEQVRWFLR
jgi:hypothetical protein